jgi:hypothetical protein
MKSAFALACFAAVNSVDANLLDDAKQYWADFPVTREQAIRKSNYAVV